MDWAIENLGRILSLGGQHLILAVVPLALGLVISLPPALAPARLGRVEKL